MKKKMLIVVDMQNDFVYGSLGSKEAQDVVKNVENKITEHQRSGSHIIFTRDTHNENYLETNEGKNLPVKHCVKGTDGWKIIDQLEPYKTSFVNKDTFGYIGWGTLIEEEGLDEVELVGLCTDICVVSNALIIKAIFPEMKITVDASCCAGVTPETHKAALQTMKMCQINVIGE